MTRIMDIENWLGFSLTWDFTQDYEYMVKRIFYDKIPTAFARYNEGEYWLISKKWFVWAGKLRQTNENHNLLADDMLPCLKRDEPWYALGICSQQYPEANAWYKEQIPHNRVTFATIFANNNYKKFQHVLNNIRENCVVICHESAGATNFPFRVIDMIWVPYNVVEYYETGKNEIVSDIQTLASKWDNTLFLFAGGPLTNVLIDFAWQTNRSNRYIDIGSPLDIFIHKRPTRQYYHEGSRTFNQIDIL